MDSYPPFWMVYRLGGEPPVKRHRERSEAEAEARRIANMHPGDDVMVLAALARFHVPERMVVERFDPTEELPF